MGTAQKGHGFGYCSKRTQIIVMAVGAAILLHFGWLP